MNERRSYFRIDDSIALECKTVSSEQVKNTTAEHFFPFSHSLKILGDLKKIDAENALILPQIKENNRDLAEYLYNLNRKIDLISTQLADDIKPTTQVKTLMLVNLSEGGIAFGHASHIEVGSYIALKLVFLPSFASLAVFAHIMRCDLTDTGEYEIAAQFEGITAEQQQLIGQQIMRAQLAERRRRTQNN